MLSTSAHWFSSQPAHLEQQPRRQRQVDLTDLIDGREAYAMDGSIKLGRLISGDARQLLQLDPTHNRRASEAQLVQLREEDLAFMRRSFRQLFAREPESVRAVGQQLFARISQPTWSVEWNLPRWLGAVCELSEDQQRQLVAVNVFGLGFVRLHDDRQDGEAAPESLAASRRLEAVLKQAAEQKLQALVGGQAWFWVQYQQYLERWQRISRSQLLTLNVFDLDPGRLTHLADIGAPLLIGCAAGCTLSPGQQNLDQLTTPVQHYLVAAVLYDHLKDWRDDLASGRPNLFITAMLGASALEMESDEIRSKMHRAWMKSQQVQDYIRLLLNELNQASASAQETGLATFASHLRALEAEASASGKRMLKGIESLLTQAAELVLPTLQT